MPKMDPTDHYSPQGAAQLAERIAAHWQARGFAGIVVTRYAIADYAGLYGIRSNIGPDGWPPRTRARL